ncbi:MAG: hypothetical protein K2M43_00450 [Mycoplasmoidaceae bacterium]|nr:hypothetical protein [Mycoplasmoidaceae bacterium]
MLLATQTGIGIFAQILGYVGAICIGIFSFPQLVRVIKTKDTYTVPLLMYCILALGSLCFMTQGIINMAIDPSVWEQVLGVTIANVFSFGISFTVLLIKLVNIFMAKKLKITEEQYCKNKLEKKLKKAKGGKR